MAGRLRFLLNRISERLWVKPLAMCLLSIAAAFAARTVDHTGLGGLLPDITSRSINTLLSVIASSMLVIADDISQNALSAFIGAFIFSIVALIAIENSYVVVRLQKAFESLSTIEDATMVAAAAPRWQIGPRTHCTE